MNVLCLIVGILVGYFHFIRLVKFVLCCGTSYAIMKLIRPDLEIWDLQDYDILQNYKDFFNSRLFVMSTIFTILSWIIFYILIPFFTSKLINKKTSFHIKSALSKLTPNDNAKILVVTDKIIRWVTRFSIKYSVKKPIKLMPLEEHLTYNEYLYIIITTLSLSIHCVVCLLTIEYFSLLPLILVVTIIVLIVLVVAVLSPVYDKFKTEINRIAIDEYNKFVR